MVLSTHLGLDTQYLLDMMADLQRTTWFQRGLNSGKIAACNTFGGR
jgi:hypothetical protein